MRQFLFIHSIRFKSGECLEAMERYKNIFGGYIKYFTYRDAGIKVDQPDLICSCDLIIDNDVFLIGSDGSDETFEPGTNVSVMVLSEDIEWAKDKFMKLALGGEVEIPLGFCEWGADYGTLVDRFGTHWVFNIAKRIPPESGE